MANVTSSHSQAPYPELISRTFSRLIAEGKSEVAAQVISDAREELFFPEELEDPIGDERFSPLAGIVHRYPDRLLLKITSLCAVHCRFCFRRDLLPPAREAKTSANMSVEELEAAYAYIASHPDIWEVIFTGGDPLVLSNSHLKSAVERLRLIPHVKVLRFHTRVPTALPERINASLLSLLKNSEKSVWLVAHINSAEELTPEACAAIRRLRDVGVSLVSQSVLLKGVNDSFASMSALLKALVTQGIKPYYLHYPDLARGTSHFRVPLDSALELMRDLRARVSGLCIPDLIVDIPGGYGKITLTPDWASRIDAATWDFRSPLTGETIRVRYPAVAP